MKVDELIKQAYREANEKGQCGEITGEETLREVCELFFDNLKFCFKHHTPSHELLHKFKSAHPEEYGIYIDAGEITLKNPTRVFIIGDTEATIECDELKPCHLICMMHGARVTLNAKGWAVCRVDKDDTSHLTTNLAEHALLL